MDVETYRSLSSALFAASIDPSQWSLALERLSREVPGANTHIFGHNHVTGESLISCTQGYDPYWLGLFEQHYATMNPWGDGFFTAPEGKILSAIEMCPEDKLLKTEFYADWARPQDDIIRGGGCVLGRTSRTVGMIGANIPLRYADRLEGTWLDMLQNLMPALRKSWEISQIFAEGLLERLLLQQSGARDPAIFLLSESGLISFQNAQAAELLISGGKLKADARGRLRFHGDRAQQLLVHMLRDMRRGPVHAHLDLDGKISGLRVTMFAFDPDQVPGWNLGILLGIDRPSLLVCLSRIEVQTDPLETLAASYGLSAAQAQVALELADGQSLREIAEHRNTSINTVRTQVRTVAEKMDVSRQAEIVAVVLTHLAKR